jgi:endogenous inhibitor of DNA gyrase (YacG/DUF329 family)
MSEMRCPICGRKTVEVPAGHVAPCGRQVTWADDPAVIYPGHGGFPVRVNLVRRCEGARHRVA